MHVTLAMIAASSNTHTDDAGAPSQQRYSAGKWRSLKFLSQFLA